MMSALFTTLRSGQRCCTGKKIGLNSWLHLLRSVNRKLCIFIEADDKQRLAGNSNWRFASEVHEVGGFI